MFDISFSELALCFIVALVVLGPERLPAIARALGRWTGKARAFAGKLTNELEQELQLGEIRRQFRDTQQSMLQSKAMLDNLDLIPREPALPMLPVNGAGAQAAVVIDPAITAVTPSLTTIDETAPTASRIARAPLPPSEQQYP